MQLTSRLGFVLQVSSTNPHHEKVVKETRLTQESTRSLTNDALPCPRLTTVSTCGSVTPSLSLCSLTSSVSSYYSYDETITASVSSCSLTTVSTLSCDCIIDAISTSTSINSIASTAVKSPDNVPSSENISKVTTCIAVNEESCAHDKIAREEAAVPQPSRRPSRFKRWRRHIKQMNIFSGYMCSRIVQCFAINNLLL